MTKKRNRLTEYYPWIALGGAFLLLLFLNVFYLEHWLDSDMAAEMMFSRLLSEEGRIFASKNWYYSTEFRFLYTHLVMGPLFRISDNWHLIRLVTNVIFYILLLAAYFYMMKPVLLDKKKKILGAAVLLLPFSETMMLHMHMGNTYLSHVIILFFFIGLFLRLGEGGRHILLWALYLLLAVVCGISGVRYLLALQCPLVIACFWALLREEGFKELRKKPGAEPLRLLCSGRKCRYFLISLAGLLGAVAGYGVNALYVSRTYSFQTYESTNFIDVYQGIFLERVQDAFGSLLMLFGYIPGKSVLSLRGIVTFASFALLILLAVCAVRAGKIKKPEREFFVLLFYSSFFLNVFVFIFTKSTLVPRYYITTLVWLIPVTGFYLEEEERPLDRYAVAALLMCCLLLGTAKTSLSMITTDKNEARYPVIEELVKEGYSFGYATYWNGNITQELSDGKLELANLNRKEEGEPEFFRWSSMSRYYDADYAPGKVFLLLTAGEADEWKNTEILRNGKEIYRSADFVVYHYDNNRALLEAVKTTA